MKSPAETLLAVQLEQAGIPFEREYQFAPEEWCIERGYVTPKRRQPKKWRADFAIETWRGGHYHQLLIEVEGGTWTGGRHVTGSGFAADSEKYNAATELHYKVLRYTPAQVESGEALEQIRRILSMKKEEAA
jgi:hypothetical protein